MKRNRTLSLLTILLVTALGGLGACGPASQDAAERLKEGSDLTSRANEALIAGDAQTAADLYLEAERAYQEALSHEPDRETRVDIYANLGVVYYQLGRLDDAIESYQAGLDLAPEDADIYSNLGAAYVQKALEAAQTSGGQQASQGYWEQARDAYQAAVQRKPELAQAHFGLGVIHMQLGQNEAAIAAFEAFQEHDTGTDRRATEDAAFYLEQLKGGP